MDKVQSIRDPAAWVSRDLSGRFLKSVYRLKPECEHLCGPLYPMQYILTAPMSYGVILKTVRQIEKGAVSRISAAVCYGIGEPEVPISGTGDLSPDMEARSVIVSGQFELNLAPMRFEFFNQSDCVSVSLFKFMNLPVDPLRVDAFLERQMNLAFPRTGAVPNAQEAARETSDMNHFYSPKAGYLRRSEPARIERRVSLPSSKDPNTLWSDDYLFKLNGKWYEHHEGEWRMGGHNDGGASTWERRDLDDEKVDALIREGRAGKP